MNEKRGGVGGRRRRRAEEEGSIREIYSIFFLVLYCTIETRENSLLVSGKRVDAIDKFTGTTPPILREHRRSPRA